MNTGVIYLNLTTLNTSGILCKAAIRTELNAAARTFSQDIGIKYQDAWTYERVEYTQIRRNNRLVKGFTSVNKETNEYTMYTFPYVLDECAVIKKQTNTSRGPSNVCELWVNYKFFDRKPENVKLCTKNFQSHCKSYNATRYNIEYCHENSMAVLWILYRFLSPALSTAEHQRRLIKWPATGVKRRNSSCRLRYLLRRRLSQERTTTWSYQPV
ncbi:hypothetical protein MRX96_040434 [Rhipicephalus microplus]